jgi:hypothetical protein
MLRGRIHYSRLVRDQLAKIHLQIGGGPYSRKGQDIACKKTPSVAASNRGANGSSEERAHLARIHDKDVTLYR